MCKDRQGLLLDISAALSTTNTFVLGINSRSTEDEFAIFRLEIRVKDGTQLKSVMNKLNQISGVLKVTRPAGIEGTISRPDGGRACRHRSGHSFSRKAKRRSSMRAVVTRVASASVTIDGTVNGRIGRGFLVLLGVGPNDTGGDRRKAGGEDLQPAGL